MPYQQTASHTYAQTHAQKLYFVICLFYKKINVMGYLAFLLWTYACRQSITSLK